jgi:hypothetical protein
MADSSQITLEADTPLNQPNYLYIPDDSHIESHLYLNLQYDNTAQYFPNWDQWNAYWAGGLIA